MSQIVVDTDVASYIFNWHSLAKQYAEALCGSELILSFMSVAELRMGAMSAGWGSNRRRLQLPWRWTHLSQPTTAGISRTSGISGCYRCDHQSAYAPLTRPCATLAKNVAPPAQQRATERTVVRVESVCSAARLKAFTDPAGLDKSENVSHGDDWRI